MVDYVAKRLGMDYRDYVTQNPSLCRTRRIKITLKVTQTERLEKHWVGNQEYTFETLMDDILIVGMK
jgi:hypothetical protein